MTRRQGYKTFYMLNSTEHEITNAHKTIMKKKYRLFNAFKVLDVVFIMLINVKVSTIVGILTFSSILNFMLS